MTLGNENAIEAMDVGKRYRSFWALRDCNITVPMGSVSALVGPNGAGKTTLLKLLAGLNRPSAGHLTVLAQSPSRTTQYLSGIGYLAQETPLYSNFTAADHFRIGAHLDADWDNALAVERLSELRIPLDRPVGELSGGQRSQVGLAMALSKKPKLLVLDEPVAALDPLARVDFLATLAQAVSDADGALTVVMSSHLLADLERISDHVILLASGETQLCGSIDDVLETHKVLVGSSNELPRADGCVVIKESRSSTTAHLLVRLDPGLDIPGWHVRSADIEEIVLAYMEQNRGKAGAR